MYWPPNGAGNVPAQKSASQHIATNRIQFRTKEQLIEDTPSRRDGISWMEESKLRRAICEFIDRLAVKMGVPAFTAGLAQYLAQLFYLAKSLQRNDRFIVAVACLFLACKIEETPKNLRDMISKAYEIRHAKESEAADRIKKDKQLAEDIKSNVLMAERAILYLTGFSFHWHTPHQCLTSELEALGFKRHDTNLDVDASASVLRYITLKATDHNVDGFKSRSLFFTQVAWNLCNDCVRSTLCLQYHPLHLAHAAIYLASRISEKHLQDSYDGAPWFIARGTSADQIESICRDILECFVDGERKDALVKPVQ